MTTPTQTTPTPAYNNSKTKTTDAILNRIKPFSDTLTTEEISDFKVRLEMQRKLNMISLVAESVDQFQLLKVFVYKAVKSLADSDFCSKALGQQLVSCRRIEDFGFVIEAIDYDFHQNGNAEDQYSQDAVLARINGARFACELFFQTKINLAMRAAIDAIGDDNAALDIALNSISALKTVSLLEVMKNFHY